MQNEKCSICSRTDVFKKRFDDVLFCGECCLKYCYPVCDLEYDSCFKCHKKLCNWWREVVAVVNSRNFLPITMPAAPTLWSSPPSKLQ